MATMQQCVTKMKEKDMELNPDTCTFVSKPKFQPRPIDMQTKKPILKTGQFFEKKQPSGLNAELAEIVPAVKFNRKKYKNTQKFNNPNTWSPEPIPEPIPEVDLKKLTKSQLKQHQAQLKQYQKELNTRQKELNKQREEEEKEENRKLAMALLPPTNNPSVFGTKTLQQVYDEGRDTRYIPSEWTKAYKYTPAEVRSSINLTRAKKAKETNTNYGLQPFNKNALVQRMKEKEAREKIKRDLENKAKENKARATRKLQVRKKANAKRTNVAQPRKGRKKEAQEPVAKNTELLEKVKARKREVERLAEIEKNAKYAELKARGNRAQAEADLLANELGSNSGSNANLRLTSSDEWNLYQKREGEKHMAR